MSERGMSVTELRALLRSDGPPHLYEMRKPELLALASRLGRRQPKCFCGKFASWNADREYWECVPCNVTDLHDAK